MSLDQTTLPTAFPAVFVAEPGVSLAELRPASEADLGDGDVLIAIAYSALNYKDGLALTGVAPVVRRFPMIGGIDLAGTVIASTSRDVNVGDMVVVTGAGLGEEHPGGYAHFARVPASWCVRLPADLSSRAAAAVGTAGITAMLSLMALERNRSKPNDLGEFPLVVTGASGGVGSLAVLFASRLGYRVVASTGRVREHDYLTRLGASEVIDRRELSEVPPGALGKVRFGAGIDSVGGATLANLLRTTRPEGTIAACGLAGGVDLSLTVHPFILRGVMLAGINSVRPHEGDREEAWRRIAEIVTNEDLDRLTVECSLDEVVALGAGILRGEVRGRVVVDVRR